MLLSNLNRFFNFFSLEDSLVICSKMDTKNLTTPCICCHTTLWNTNVRKQAINDKLHGSVATYLRPGGLSMTKVREVYCWVCQWNFLILEYLAKLQARRWLSHALRVRNTLLIDLISFWPTLYTAIYNNVSRKSASVHQQLSVSATARSRSDADRGARSRYCCCLYDALGISRGVSFHYLPISLCVYGNEGILRCRCRLHE